MLGGYNLGQVCENSHKDVLFPSLSMAIAAKLMSFVANPSSSVPCSDLPLDKACRDAVGPAGGSGGVRAGSVETFTADTRAESAAMNRAG